MQKEHTRSKYMKTTDYEAKIIFFPKYPPVNKIDLRKYKIKIIPCTLSIISHTQIFF